ncbi:MAG: response regulator transcription factor, partial [Comamonadaceae bacterium]
MFLQDSDPHHPHTRGDTAERGVQREAWLYAAASDTGRAIAHSAFAEGLVPVELNSREQLDARCAGARARDCGLLVFALDMEASPAVFLSHIRQLIGPQVPVLVLSRPADASGLPALVQPAHTDFVLSGADPHEVALRLQLLLNRAQPVQAPQQLGFGPYVVHLAQRIVTRDGEELPISQVECELAILMFQNLGQVVLREKLIATVDAQVRRVRLRTTRSPDIQMSRVRKVLALEANGYSLKAVYGVGYRLDAVAIP